MAKIQDYAQTVKDMLGSSPVDTSSLDNFVKSQSALAEKMSSVAIDAARQSTELYAKSATDFMSQTAEAAAEHMAAFAEIAKKVQTETLELMLAAGKDMSEDMTSAAKKAGDEMTAAARKVTSNATGV